MKTINKYLLSVLIGLFALTAYGQAAGVGIGTDNPDDSAIMDVTSTDRGFLLPRLTSGNTVTNPPAGLIIYNLTENCVQVHNGTEWRCINFVMNTYRDLFIRPEEKGKIYGSIEYNIKNS